MPCRQVEVPACRRIAASALERAATNGLRFGGDQGTMTVPKKMIAGPRQLNATLTIEQTGFESVSASPAESRRSDLERCLPVSVGGPRDDEASINRAGPIMTNVWKGIWVPPCATISDDVGRHARRAFGHFLARHLIALGSDRLFAGRRGARVQNTRCPGREFFGLAVFSSLRNGWD